MQRSARHLLTIPAIVLAAVSCSSSPSMPAPHPLEPVPAAHTTWISGSDIPTDIAEGQRSLLSTDPTHIFAVSNLLCQRSGAIVRFSWSTQTNVAAPVITALSVGTETAGSIVGFVETRVPVGVSQSVITTETLTTATEGAGWVSMMDNAHEASCALILLGFRAEPPYPLVKESRWMAQVTDQ